MNNIIIISSRVEDIDKPAKRSKKRTCSKCLYPIWVSREVLKQVKHNQPKFMCTRCVFGVSNKN